jgi:hypothetical protein
MKLNKVRYNDIFGLDLEQVIAWRRVPTGNINEWDLEVYIPGNKIVFKKNDDGFDYLLRTLSTGCGFSKTQHTV